MVHILVVDDDAVLNKTVCTWLGDCGFQAKGVLDAQAAYDELYNSLYDLIISDIMMPGIDGFEFAKTVRAVDVYITKLRDKFSGCDGFEIKTVRGLGYKAVLK